MSQRGEVARIGGHGYLLGDEGGGYWIGREGIASVLRARDGRGPATQLDGPAAEHFGGLDDLGDRLHSSDRPVNTIALFAPAVLSAAKRGDEVASAIVEAAAQELLALISVAAAWAAPAGGSVPVALGGRLLAAGILRRRLEVVSGDALPAASIHDAMGTPLDGALRLGAGTDPGPYEKMVYTWQVPA
jgi:N-acetylglucosamine kinase-like BadF-type ATPase